MLLRGNCVSNNNFIPILMYHSIHTEATPKFRRWTLTPTDFDLHMAYLAEAGYTTWTMSEFFERRGDDQLPEKVVVITFDDAFEDFYTNALPTLQKHSFSATLYIPTGLVGKTSRWLVPEGEENRPLMNWVQINEAESLGIECGAHSETHPHLDEISLNSAREQIENSKKVLEVQLGHVVDTFAYPYGHFDKRVYEIVREAGFKTACAVRHAYSSPQDDPLGLARVRIIHETDVAELKTFLSGEVLNIGPFPELLKKRVWRVVRRVRSRLR